MISLAATLLHAQLAPGKREDPVKLSMVPAGHAGAGQAIQPRVTIEIKKGWHVFSQKPEVAGIVPTKLSIQAGPGFEFDKAVFPKPEKAFSSIFEKEITFYENTVSVPIDLKIKPDAKGTLKIEGQLDYQACSESLCLPPAKKKFSGEQKLD